jgi:predicted glycosyltransferase
MRSTVIREVLARFRPDLVLVDHMPGGANRDLVPALRLIRTLEYPTKVVLGLRDIIDAPSVTCAVWQRERFYETLKRFYDAVLIYGAKDVFPTATMYGVDGVVPDGVRYCGYVCNMDPVKDPQQVRARFELGDEPIVVVMAGGGADAFNLMQTYLQALPLFNGGPRFTTVMVTGPFMPEAQRKALREQAKALGVQIRTSVGDSLSQINAASLVVSMAGYNTISEILRFRKPAVVVPRAGPSAEQRMRATTFAERGWLTLVEPLELSPARLADAIGRALRNPAPPSTSYLPALHGISTVTGTLLELLQSRESAGRSMSMKKNALKAGAGVYPARRDLPRRAQW